MLPVGSLLSEGYTFKILHRRYHDMKVEKRTTLSNGSLGSRNDEERSQLRNVV